MRNVYLLDCTLRDGGYLNDWEFGQNSISSIFARLVSSNVDVIEVGFLDERRTFDQRRTIMPDTASVGIIFGEMDRGNSMIVGMIDYGTCGIENIQPCQDSYLDGIRVIFKKEKMHEAVDYCRQIKDLGYKVFVQAVSITSYNEEELRELVALVNACHPYAMSMVDTYGLCDAPTLASIVKVIDKDLDPDICLGYHAHNNFQLGYANAVSILNLGLERDVLVDGTLYGMGKSAGNAPLELLAMYMNMHFGTRYDLGQIQEVISTCILDLYHKKPWGYTLFYYIAASNRCHPDYVSYLMNKRTLSVTSINEILQRIPEDKKLGKDIKMMESLYLEYQMRECDDTDALADLRTAFAGRTVLALGPGKNAKLEQNKIQQYINRNNPFVISVNYIPEGITAPYLFLTNAHRYLQMSSNLTRQENRNTQIIATSNVNVTGIQNVYKINYARLIDEKAEFPDNSMMMLIRLLLNLGVTDIALAGFDGYTADSLNYFDKNMEYSFVKEKADYLNKSGKQFLSEVSDQVNVTFVTNSYYQE